MVTDRIVEVQGNVGDGNVTYNGAEVSVFLTVLMLVDVTNKAFES